MTVDAIANDRCHERFMQKVVPMSFPDEAEFRSWSESRHHQDISKDREARADSVVLLVKGPA